MMTNRRGALLAFAFAAFGGAGWCISRKRRPNQGGVTSTSFAAFAAPLMDNTDDRLRADLERLSGRVYSEEGIPMFLGCENLVPNQTAQVPVPLTALNKDLASAFRRDADAWVRMHPDAHPMDVAKIIEMLADRDFASGGAEKSL